METDETQEKPAEGQEQELDKEPERPDTEKPAERSEDDDYLDFEAVLDQHKDEFETAALVLPEAGSKVPRAWAENPDMRKVLAWAASRERAQREEVERRVSEAQAKEDEALRLQARARRVSAQVLEEPAIQAGAAGDAVLKALREAQERRQNIAQQVAEEERNRESEALRTRASKESERLFDATRKEAKAAGLDPAAAFERQRQLMQQAFDEADRRKQPLLFSDIDELRTFHEQMRALAFGQLARERAQDETRKARSNMRAEVTGRVSTRQKSGLEVPDYHKDPAAVMAFIMDTMPE